MNVAVIVNKSAGVLGPSETFIEAQIAKLPCNVITLIGNPLRRRLLNGNAKFAPERRASRVMRWLLRQTRLDSAHAQDTRELIQFLTSQDVDVVLAQYGPTAVSVMDACSATGTPLVAHFHGFDVYRTAVVRNLAAQYERLFEYAAVIVAVSEHMRQALVKLGAPSGKICVIPCGAALPAGKVARPSEAGPKFVMVGRLTEKKNPLLSLKAFASVASDYPHARLDVVGDGPLSAACNELTNRLRLTDRVEWHGAQPHDAALDIMSKARCFIQHSVRAADGDHEGTPVSVLEAMGLGLPVVATRHGGISEVIETARCGILVDEFDLDGMANAMLRIAENDELADTLGHSGRTAVLNYWTAEKSVQHLWDALAACKCLP